MKSAEQKNAETFDLGTFVADIARSQAHAVRIGAEITHNRYGRAISGLREAYQRSLLDPETKIPSALAACIMALIATYEADQINLQIPRPNERAA